MARQILSKEETIAVKRERIPVHEARNKISNRGLDTENYYYRFIDVNDPDNVSRFVEAGYEFVQKAGTRVGDIPDSAEGISSLVTITGGRGKTLALVCLPWELKNQDDKAQENKILEQERDQRRKLAALSDPAQGNLGRVDELNSRLGANPLISDKG